MVSYTDFVQYLRQKGGGACAGGTECAGAPACCAVHTTHLPFVGRNLVLHSAFAAGSVSASVVRDVSCLVTRDA